MAILTALHSISENSFVQEGREEYYKLPENSRYIFDFLIRNVTVKAHGKTYQTDLGIDRSEVNYENATKFFYQSKIEDYGDLSIYFGSEEFDATGYTLENGKTLTVSYSEITQLEKFDPWELLKEGYTYIKTNLTSEGIFFTKLPLHILMDKSAPTSTPTFEDIPTFILTQNGEVKFAVVNGFLYDLSMEAPFFYNGVIE